MKEQLGMSYLTPIPGGAGGGRVCKGHGFNCDEGELYLKWVDGVSEVSGRIQIFIND